jgi:predicted O-methyltransferase YrrM
MNGRPWMHPKEVELINKFLGKDKIMLEWGSGGSTIYFSKRVKKLYSIEHNKEYCNKLNGLTPKNTNLYCIPPNKTIDIIDSDFSSYENYITKTNDFKEKFDVILIDGRARVECAKQSLKLIKENGVVLIHDFWNKSRLRYQVVLDFFKELESVKDTPQTIIALKKIYE